MSRNLEWGIDNLGTRPSYDLSCPNPECERSGHNMDYKTEQYHASIAVGVRSRGNELRPFTLICECPGCFTKYWFHITSEEAERLADSDF
jgi:hypothetical protein